MPESPRYVCTSGRTVDVTEHIFIGGSLIVTAWRRQSPPWPARDKSEPMIHMPIVSSSVS